MISGGRIIVGDRNVTLLPPTERDVSMVFQSYALFPHLSVRENVAYGLVVSGTRRLWPWGAESCASRMLSWTAWVGCSTRVK